MRALDEQIDKLQETDKQIPRKSKLRNKALKIEEVLKALKRRQVVLEDDDSGSRSREQNLEAPSLFEGEEDMLQDEEMASEEET